MGLGEPGRHRGASHPSSAPGVCPQGSRPRFLVSPARAGDAGIVTCKPGELWGGRPLGESRERGSGRGSLEVERMRSGPVALSGRWDVFAGPRWPKFIPWAGSHPIPSQLKAYGGGIPLGCKDATTGAAPRGVKSQAHRHETSYGRLVRGRHRSQTSEIPPYSSWGSPGPVGAEQAPREP